MPFNIVKQSKSSVDRVLASSQKICHEYLRGMSEDISDRLKRANPALLRKEAARKMERLGNTDKSDQHDLYKTLLGIEQRGLQDVYQKRREIHGRIDRMQAINTQESSPCFIIDKNTSRDELIRIRTIIEQSQKYVLNKEEKLFLNIVLDQVQGCMDSLDIQKTLDTVCIPLKFEEEIYAKKLNAKLGGGLLDQVQCMMDGIENDKKITTEERHLLADLAERLYGIINTHQMESKKQDTPLDMLQLKNELVGAVDSAVKAAKDITITTGWKGWINYILTACNCDPYYKLDSQSVSENAHSMKKELESLRENDERQAEHLTTDHVKINGP